MPCLAFTLAVLLLAAANAAAQTTVFVTVDSLSPGVNGPVPGATIFVMPTFEEKVVAKARTDAQGHATLAVESGRSYVVTAVAPGFEPESEGSFFAVKGDVAVGVVLAPAGFHVASLAPIDASIEAERQLAVIAGVVTDESGRPISGVVVDARDESHGGGSGASDATGRFRLRVRAGTYTVRTQLYARHLCEGEKACALHPPSDSTVVIVSPREVIDRVLLRVRAISRTIVRVKVTAGGQPVNGALVRMYTGRDAPVPRGQGAFRTEADGVVRMGPVVPGRVLLVVRVGDGEESLGAMEEVDVIEGAGPIVVQLSPGARVVGRVQYIGRDRPLHSISGIRVVARVPGQAMDPYGEGDDGALVSETGAFSLGGLVGRQCLHVVGLTGQLTGLMHGHTNIADRIIEFGPGDVLTDVVAIVEPGAPPMGGPECR